MQVFSLAAGSVLLVLFAVMSAKGRKFNSYVENLDSSDYPLKDFCTVGFAWAEKGPLAFKGKVKNQLVSQARLLYPPQYAEYYANLVWAQTVAAAHLSLCVGFVSAGAFDFAFFGFVGIICAAVFAFYFFGSMKQKIEKRRLDCVTELPEIVSSMALLINSGMVLREAWKRIAFSKSGAVYELMQNVCDDMDNGMSDIDAMHKFGVISDTPEIKKFTGALIQGLEKGSSELSGFLTAQSSEMWGLKKQVMLQKGEKAASKLLIPITLIFLGVMIIVISAAIGMLI